MRLGHIIWQNLSGSAAQAVNSVQGCYTLVALLHDDQPDELKTAVASELVKLKLGDPDEQGDNGKPLPRAVLAKAVYAIVV